MMSGQLFLHIQSMITTIASGSCGLLSIQLPRKRADDADDFIAQPDLREIAGFKCSTVFHSYIMIRDMSAPCEYTQ